MMAQTLGDSGLTFPWQQLSLPSSQTQTEHFMSLVNINPYEYLVNIRIETSEVFFKWPKAIPKSGAYCGSFVRSVKT